MAVSKRLRYEILRRDQHTCRYCGASAPAVPLRVDHVTPVALGGTDTPDNLVTSCEPCNSGKSSATVDAATVADVSDDALRWAAAMTQAAEELREQQAPKVAYRQVFQDAWNGWTWERDGKKETFDLPKDWKGSLDAFREAGLPQDVWPDIVEKSMTNKTVRSENLFRYCCGIGWRMVGELQERARAIVGVTPDASNPIDSVVQAAVDTWKGNKFGDISDDELARFEASAVAAREAEEEDAHRIVQAGQYAAWYGETEVVAALAKLDRDEALQEWTFAWLSAAGEWPDDEPTEQARTQIDRLLNGQVNVARVTRAAIYAGSRRSVRIYFGLSEAELKISGQHEVISKSVEAWVQAYHSTAGHWPSKAEVSAFFASMRRIGADGEIWIDDIYPAAAAAGAYLDPDISTCLTRHLSVFEAAARPLAPAA
ncbi:MULTISPECIES: HNH endonuclease [Streptomyces]|uniref:HNH endonuclease n=1 Tax=Streptomyces dengpaensis TaxID=2049881 RepID=A0ABN5I9R3_9ACTN|nr:MULTISPECIES: HNH endonuclease [Streptomyces]AVH59935.1 HNH endonuclease [Streptomyces dengpaensis]PIB09570.1 hypothetical protein B1C81_10515 [Streptomyces sp. HG99]